MTSTDGWDSSDTKSGRVYYIDWLRVLAVLVLVPYHTGRIFLSTSCWSSGPT
jgi:peptidoglycan/LPS O-acetylase OafA/YrhL